MCFCVCLCVYVCSLLFSNLNRKIPVQTLLRFLGCEKEATTAIDDDLNNNNNNADEEEEELPAQGDEAEIGQQHEHEAAAEGGIGGCLHARMYTRACTFLNTRPPSCVCMHAHHTCMLTVTHQIHTSGGALEFYLLMILSYCEALCRRALPLDTASPLLRALCCLYTRSCGFSLTPSPLCIHHLYTLACIYMYILTYSFFSYNRRR